MGQLLFRRGRLAAVTLVGLGLVIGLSLRSRGSFSGIALAAGIDAAPTDASPKPDALSHKADRVVEKADDISDLADDSDMADLPALQGKFQSIARRVAPAVVSIAAAQTASDADSALCAQAMNPQKLDALLDKTTRTIGTGFVVDPDGFIVTNEHVIEDSQQFWVTTDDHKVYPAIVVGADPRADLAVLKIPASNLPTVAFARGPTQRGQWAITLGNPYGLAADGQMSLSVGVISATDRSLPKLASKEDRLYSDLIQTTAQINPGNSGGPLLDVDGQVVGIDAAVILPQKQTNGIGFAISITPELLDEIRQLEQGREVVYGYVGVTVSAPTPRQRRDAKLDDDIGVFVETIEAKSPAAGSGLCAGDMIVEVNGMTATDTDRFVRLIGAAPVGRTTAIVVLRNAKRMVIHLTPVKRPVQYVVSNQNQRLYWRGMVLGPVPTNWPGTAGNDKPLSGILVVGIEDDSPLKKRGVCAGTIITAIAGQPVKTLLDFQKVLSDFPPEKCDVQLADQVVAAQ
ncbi:MAG TPA: trypsin-like peptidase domain-containing protein [Tepidisphaeraceae bacterium]|jgi:serine protease Do|nr:trypsin-like peptidase domain-containing protein [Tepidisphaeraceae bacterium]